MITVTKEIVVSDHAAKRLLKRKYNKLPPYALNDRERAAAEIEATILSGKWRYATAAERKRYYEDIEADKEVLATTDGFYLVHETKDKIDVITLVDELVNIVTNIHNSLSDSTKRRKGRRRH